MFEKRNGAKYKCDWIRCDKDIESDWGARDHVLPSSDSISPTDSSQMLQSTDREPILPKSQVHSQPSVQPVAPSQTQGVGLRRSSRSTRGKTTRFDDCVTGEELEALGDDQWRTSKRRRACRVFVKFVVVRWRHFLSWPADHTTEFGHTVINRYLYGMTKQTSIYQRIWALIKMLQEENKQNLEV